MLNKIWILTYNTEVAKKTLGGEDKNWKMLVFTVCMGRFSIEYLHAGFII